MGPHCHLQQVDCNPDLERGIVRSSQSHLKLFRQLIIVSVKWSVCIGTLDFEERNSYRSHYLGKKTLDLLGVHPLFWAGQNESEEFYFCGEKKQYRANSMLWGLGLLVCASTRWMCAWGCCGQEQADTDELCKPSEVLGYKLLWFGRCLDTFDHTTFFSYDAANIKGL